MGNSLMVFFIRLDNIPERLGGGGGDDDNQSEGYPNGIFVPCACCSLGTCRDECVGAPPPSASF